MDHTRQTDKTTRAPVVPTNLTLYDLCCQTPQCPCHTQPLVMKARGYADGPTTHCDVPLRQESVWREDETISLIVKWFEQIINTVWQQ